MTAGTTPLHIRGNLETDLRRGLWLVKWLLAIPHFVVLAVLWAMFTISTIVAGGMILFTGRFPRSLFEFNVGVIRWTWRVAFYAFTLGTDRYPPFSIKLDETYPADLDVDYPERLSRPLVLVKWWLLAIPHYLIVSVFGGGVAWWAVSFSDERTEGAAGFGLIGLLALVAGFALLFGRGYPRDVFAFIMGLQRWSYRVLVYAALMTDAYPPFRLDLGGLDPASATPPAVDRMPEGTLSADVPSAWQHVTNESG